LAPNRCHAKGEIADASLKTNRIDAEILARLGRQEDSQLRPVYQRSERAQEPRHSAGTYLEQFWREREGPSKGPRKTHQGPTEGPPSLGGTPCSLPYLWYGAEEERGTGGIPSGRGGAARSGLTIRLGYQLDLVRLRWVEGRLAGARGRTAEALAAFEQVRGEFTTRGIAYDAALVTLELAVLLLEEGRTAEVQALVPELAWIFESQGVARELLATLQLFAEAVEREVITVALAQRFLADLRRRPAAEPPRLGVSGMGPA
jgi:hypothetical protein